MPKRKVTKKRKEKKVGNPTVANAIQSRAFTIVALFAIILVTVSLSKSLIRKVEIREQITELETEISTLEQHNAELNDLMQYFNSSDFQDKEARKKLGLKEEGETVVIIPQDDDRALVAISDEQEQVDDRTNPQKWKAYFFNK